MIVSIHQPSYFPWLGWLDKVIHSDVFILMNDVQLTDSAYQHRNIFLTKDGEEKYLNIGIKKKGYKDISLKDIELLSIVKWQSDHQKFLQANYAKHPFYKEVMEYVTPIFTKEYNTLGEVLTYVTDTVWRMLDIPTKLIFQHSMEYNKGAKKGELVIELVKAVKGDTYLSGQGAKAYADEADFEKNHIELVYQEFKHPKYYQLNTGGQPDRFIAGISCLDLLFNVGLEESRRIIYGV